MINTQDALPKDSKPSVWIRNQPLSKFRHGLMRREDKMCGLGMLADFYGIDWGAVKSGYFLHIYYDEAKVLEFLREKIGSLPFQPDEFDLVFIREGPEVARDWMVNRLVERGL